MNRDPRLPGRRGALGALLLLPCVARAELTGFGLFPVPYVPTPMPVVERMLELARIEPGDTVYDLGCGDGRIVIEAARRYGVQGVGIDLDPVRVEEALENVARAGVGDRVRIRQGDLFETDLSPADVVTLYLLPEVNQRLRPRLWHDLREGARVVSHDFHMGSTWPPDHSEKLDQSSIYAWTVRAEHKQAV
ncbi:MAG: methyltransferase domain-containing protein [Burkholderiaceae bacterium]